MYDVLCMSRLSVESAFCGRVRDSTTLVVEDPVVALAGKGG